MLRFEQLQQFDLANSWKLGGLVVLIQALSMLGLGKGNASVRFCRSFREIRGGGSCIRVKCWGWNGRDFCGKLKEGVEADLHVFSTMVADVGTSQPGKPGVSQVTEFFRIKGLLGNCITIFSFISYLLLKACLAEDITPQAQYINPYPQKHHCAECRFGTPSCDTDSYIQLVQPRITYNTLSSPLLRLSAKLSNTIWEVIFGATIFINLICSITASNGYQHASSHQISLTHARSLSPAGNSTLESFIPRLESAPLVSELRVQIAHLLRFTQLPIILLNAMHQIYINIYYMCSNPRSSSTLTSHYSRNKSTLVPSYFGVVWADHRACLTLVFSCKGRFFFSQVNKTVKNPTGFNQLKMKGVRGELMQGFQQGVLRSVQSEPQRSRVQYKRTQFKLRALYNASPVSSCDSTLSSTAPPLILPAAFKSPNSAVLRLVRSGQLMCLFGRNFRYMVPSLRFKDLARVDGIMREGTQ
ncbi:uncharacterized protein BDR25DRAFT_350538 [Lindgomyces ingoldianus]|uniref:Uncharacterized protein n=1 Tax=Lindgomyces ingoldianus TaxID=673940 RepID=A0ACB6R7Q9_9PLEO|nr:uncharacterized protein BDR25DRAFT_350538 [Lindgomyces ingoldianus]KAF2475127.1 hypothetical protein BDR25DRAFT_350538 [Lindgomyces ingoldianus]